MATYLAEFDNGATDAYEADSVDYDRDDSMFYLRDNGGQTVAWLPAINIRSIQLQDGDKR